MEPKDRIIVALDVNGIDELRRAVTALAPHVGLFKIGLEAIMAFGVAKALNIVHCYSPEGSKPRVFLDGKFADIPNTVGAAAKAAMALSGSVLPPKMPTAEIGFIDVHASSGPDAVRAACANKGGAKVLAVTVLTSLGDDVCQRIFGRVAKDAVVDLATEAVLSGADGVICSPKELPLLSDLTCLKVTPGVRPAWAAAGDQKRVMTPVEAIRGGADYLVIGRPIVQAKEYGLTQVDAAKRIADEIAAA